MPLIFNSWYFVQKPITIIGGKQSFSDFKLISQSFLLFEENTDRFPVAFPLLLLYEIISLINDKVLVRSQTQ